MPLLIFFLTKNSTEGSNPKAIITPAKINKMTEKML